MLIVAQAPFLFIALAASGTDGKASSAAKLIAAILPIVICSAYVIYRFITVEKLRALDWVAVAVACVPTFYLLAMVSIKARG